MRPSNILNLITAYDKNSYETLRSEAKIARVHSLALEVRYKQITVDTKYKLKLVGYDDQGNRFSTLDGFQFDWKIERGSEIVHIVQAKDTNSAQIT